MGYIERVNQVLEDMLCMYVMDKPSKWEDNLHLVEFAYRNGHQESLKMSPFKALNGRICRSLVSWDNLRNRIGHGPDMLNEMENEVARIQHNLKVAHYR